MRDEEQAVVQHVISGGDRHQNSRRPADGEGHDKGYGPVHGLMKPYAPAIHSKQPVESLHSGGDGNHHGGNPEKEVDVRAGPHSKKMMHPDGKGQNRDDRRGIDHGYITEQPFAGEGGHHLGINPKSRQNDDVNLGMPPGPEEVGIHHHVAAEVVGKKMHPQITIQGYHAKSDRQHRKGPDHENIGAQRRPAKQRHSHKLHAGSAHFQDSDEKIDAGHGRADAGDLEGPNPIVHPGGGTILHFGQRGIPRPAGLGEITDTQGYHDQHGPGVG